MCAYIVVGIELAMLYGLFWLFFIYEPKPYKVVGDPWGIYGTGIKRINSSKNEADSQSRDSNGWVIAEDS